MDLCFCIVNQMISAGSGKNRALPYGMAMSTILDAKIDNLGAVKMVFTSLTQYLNQGMSF